MRRIPRSPCHIRRALDRGLRVARARVDVGLRGSLTLPRGKAAAIAVVGGAVVSVSKLYVSVFVDSELPALSVEKNFSVVLENSLKEPV